MSDSTAKIDVRLSKQLVNQLYVVLRTVKIHEPNNTTVINALNGFVSIFQSLAKAWGSVTIELVCGCLYVNGIRLRVDVSGYASHRYVVEEMERFNIKSLTILSNLTHEELRAFVYAVNEFQSEKAEFERLAEMLQEKSVSNLAISKVKDSDDILPDISPEEAKVKAKKSFFSAVKVVRQIMNSASRFEAVKLRRAKRVVQAIVDSILNDESFMFSLTTIKNHDEYTFNHCVNVCIYSIAMGQRLGFSKAKLGQLGMAALFHDVGKVEIPWDILNKPAGLNQNEWELVQAHTLHGARLLARLCRLDERSLRAIIVAYEHHVNFDNSGYPCLSCDRQVDLFSRIVRITDAFDAMTTVRIYRTLACSPHESVLYLLKETGRSFDPRLVKIFVSMVGVYPVGSVLQLDTGETAVVVKPAPDIADVARPCVRIIADASGVQCGGDAISLAEVDRSGNYLRNVSSVIEGAEFGLNVPELLVGPLDVEVVAADRNAA
jgi:HD-GYP domain-containing protein (c-di-GMP phosphodiesterase class II)